MANENDDPKQTEPESNPDNSRSPIEDLLYLRDIVDKYSSEHPNKENSAVNQYVPPSNDKPPDNVLPFVPPGLPLTDAGNAERFVIRSREDVRYVHGLNAWYIWDEIRWKEDAIQEVIRLAIETVRQIHREVDGKKLTMEEVKAVFKWSTQSESRARLESMLTLAKALPPLAIAANDLDRDENLLNIENGTIDLTTCKRLDHNRSHMISKYSQVVYDPDADCPLWHAFLDRILPDKEVQGFVKRAVGYSLTGYVNEQCLFFLYGTGANGKSTFLETIRTMLGEYSVVTVPNLLLAKHNEDHLTVLANLKGSRFAISTEIGKDKSWDDAKIKLLTGGDAIAARVICGNPFSFAPTFKLWIAGNHKPTTNSTVEGFWRRFRFIPFTVTIPEGERDNKLGEKLLAELPGILNWALEGCLEWRKEGLGTPQVIIQAIREYRAEQDVIGTFLEERCIGTDSILDKILLKSLYEEYMRWCKENNEREEVTNKGFAQLLRERGLSIEKSHGMMHLYGYKMRIGG